MCYILLGALYKTAFISLGRTDEQVCIDSAVDADQEYIYS